MAEVAPVLFKKRAGKGAAARKRPATPPPDSASDSEYSSAEENGVRIKRRKTGGVRTGATAVRQDRDLSKVTAFSGDRSATITNIDDATKQSNWYESDAAAKPKSATDSAVATAPSDSYKGQAAYGSFIQKKPDAAQKAAGPVKAATNIRTITITDFAPDVCKDYKQTGFCGFGDSCKFLHAREDYKQGWQLDKDWESVGKNKTGKDKKDGGKDKPAEDDEEAMLDKIPFACIICKEPYKNPVVTKCKHYFCEACALKRHKQKNGKACAACGTDTGGTFSVAKNLRKLLDRKREREKQKKAQARAEGEDVSSDDDDETA